MSVRVVARIRPLLPKELDKDIIVRAASSEDGMPPNVVKIPSPKNEAEIFSFAFNSVYGQETSQEELFNAEGMLTLQLQPSLGGFASLPFSTSRSHVLASSHPPLPF